MLDTVQRGLASAFDFYDKTSDKLLDIFPKIWKNEGRDFNHLAWMGIIGFTVLASWRWVACVMITVEQFSK